MVFIFHYIANFTSITGPGAYSFFEQGDTTGNPFFQLVGNALRPPTRDDRECHSPKPILLMTGRMSWPYV